MCRGLAVTLALSLSGLTRGAVAAEPPSVLMVVGAQAPGDDAVRGRLSARGYKVQLVEEDQVRPEALAAARLVLVAASASAEALGTRLRDLPVPVLVLQPALYPAMGMALPGTGQGAPRLDNGALTPDAVVAVVADDPAPAVFSYDAGEDLWGFSAPARRVAMVFDAAAPSLPAERWGLFDTAVDWAAGDEVAPTAFFWTRLRLPPSGFGNIYFLTELPRANVTLEPWSVTDQSWFFVQERRPGWFNIYKVKTGSDTSRCMTTLTPRVDAPVVIESCGRGNRFFWQIQPPIDSWIRLANVETGLCLTYRHAWGGETYMDTCLFTRAQEMLRTP